VTNRFARSDGPVSKAEYAVFAALSQSATAHGMVTQERIILKSTLPDFCWIEKRKAVYLDGPVHGKDKQIAKDAEIDNLMECAGWQVLRLVYDPPLQGKALAEVINKIKEFVGE
jgi:very-short-patch-repair endonuclease